MKKLNRAKERMHLQNLIVLFLKHSKQFSINYYSMRTRCFCQCYGIYLITLTEKEKFGGRYFFWNSFPPIAFNKSASFSTYSSLSYHWPCTSFIFATVLSICCCLCFFICSKKFIIIVLKQFIQLVDHIINGAE